MKKQLIAMFVTASLCLSALCPVVNIHAEEKTPAAESHEVNAPAAGYSDENSLVHLEPLHTTQISDAKFKMLAKGTVVNSKKGFLKAFQKNAKARKKSFRISYSGSFNMNANDIYQGIGDIDDKKTSDDADFLVGGLLYLGWSGYTNSTGQMIIDCKCVYTETAAQVKKVNAQSKKILKKLKVSQLSNVAKVKVIHDYVVKLITYDNTMKDHSAYGGLAAKKHSTVCQGYSLAMYKLLTDAGVPCHYVSGNAGGPHAWNIVKINGKWYYLDATWDDPSDTTVYDYFLVGSKKLKKDHKTDSYYTKKYKISASNLNWKSLIKKSKKKQDSKVKIDQTKKEKAAAKKAIARQDFIKLMNETLDEEFQSDPDTDEYIIAMNDLNKKIYGYIVEDLSDKAFNKLLDDDAMLEMYSSGTLEYISEYIIDPMTKYMESEEYKNAVLQAMYNDFSEEEFEGLSEQELESLMDSYAYEIFTQKLYEQSEEYTEAIVAAMVETLQEMAK